MKNIGIIACLLVVAGMCASCTTTKYVEVERARTDTLYQNTVRRDSIVLTDSIHIREKGDTVRIDHWRTKLVVKELHDTMYVSTHDTVPKPYPVEVVTEVEKQLTWWQRARMFVGTVAIALALIVAVLWVVGKWAEK